jgi:hypothetical protein
MRTTVPVSNVENPDGDTADDHDLPTTWWQISDFAN